MSDNDNDKRKKALLENVNMILEDAMLRGDEMHIGLFYPRTEHAVQSFVISLTDVRAADDIRVSYDFERNGWKIEQAWNIDDPECDPDENWQEVAFLKC